MYYVYEWIRMDNKEPFYVGKGKGDRACEYKKNKHFNDTIKYCEKNDIEYCVVILENNLTEQEAFEMECWYIDNYMIEFGFKLTNKTWGGEGGNSFSLLSKEEQELYRIKMSESLKGVNKGKKHTEETKRRISLKKIGKKTGEENPMFGKSVTDFMTEEQIIEWKRKISESGKGRIQSAETKAKISQALKGKEFTEEHKKNLSESRIGAKNHRYGKHITETNRKAIREAMAKKTYFELGDIKKEFESRNDCIEYVAENYGVSAWFCKQLIKNNKPFKHTQKKHEALDGMRIYYKE